MFNFNKILDGVIGLVTTVVSVIKSEFFIEQMGTERFLMFIVLVVVMTLVMLSGPSKENR